jgi:hypothetical protein
MTITLDLSPDPDSTPLQHTHRMALEIAMTEADLDGSPVEVRRRILHAAKVYERAIDHQRKATCWAYVLALLSDARQAGVLCGIAPRGSLKHAALSRMHDDISQRFEACLEAERDGIADARR